MTIEKDIVLFTGMMSHPPIPITELEAHIDRLRSNEGALFSQEYESIEPGQQFTWDMSNREVNKVKNRYANVIAYDHSRVALQTIDGVQETSYINANYMDGYRRHNAYIATQVRLSPHDVTGIFIVLV
jgi:receptor-type tyrosine-protein phosphatase F